LLDKVADTLDSLANLAGSQSAPSSSVNVPAARSAQTSGAQQGTAQWVHFEMDFEIEMSAVTETTVAELRDQGLQVQTTRLEQTQRLSLHIEFTGVVGQGTLQQSDPLVLDLGDDGVQLSSAWDGEVFDINADGVADRTAFVRGNDAYLALDRNGNGQIDDGSELFGDQHGARNGFEELARFDDNRDGLIDSNDSVFDRLRLLYDRDGDGRWDETNGAPWPNRESRRFTCVPNGRSSGGWPGNALAERSSYTRSNGQVGQISTPGWATPDSGLSAFRTTYFPLLQDRVFSVSRGFFLFSFKPLSLLQKYEVNGDKVGGIVFALRSKRNPAFRHSRESGIQIRNDPVGCVFSAFALCFSVRPPWVPAFAGMTKGDEQRQV
jgi:hypothetical protein